MRRKKHNNLSDFRSEKFIRWAEQTTSHYEVPNRYWSKDWYRLKPTYKAIFDFLISQAKYKPTEKLGIGQCSIGTIELSVLFDIPRSTLIDILHFLEKEGEITLEPTNKYTIVTINYLTENIDVSSNDLLSPSSKTQKPVIKTRKNRHQKTVVSVSGSLTYESEAENLRHQNTENPSSKHEISDTPIYDIIDETDELVKNEFLSDNNILYKKGKHDMSSKTKTKVAPLFEEQIDISNISVQIPKEKKPNIPFIILNIWCEEYQLNRRLKYPVQKGRDLKGCKYLLLEYQKESPNATLDDIRAYFRDFFKKVLSIEDNKYIYLKAAPMFIYSELSQINIILSKHKQSYSSVGQAAGTGNYNLPLK
ncbi:MAG: hypothetical protein EPN82_05840 [Bacteroidetes bacterium]|nr:MAG: hypothetical protein EPN82_05840 [Bacteroidota bacterium]